MYFCKVPNKNLTSGPKLLEFGGHHASIQYQFNVQYMTFYQYLWWHARNECQRGIELIKSLSWMYQQICPRGVWYCVVAFFFWHLFFLFTTTYSSSDQNLYWFLLKLNDSLDWHETYFKDRPLTYFETHPSVLPSSERLFQSLVTRHQKRQSFLNFLNHGLLPWTVSPV